MTITTTSRLGLTKDDNNELYSVERVNANADKVDANIGIIVCTSSTRPSTPYNGMHIYETDTGLHGLWRSDLSSWVVPRASILATSVRPTIGIYEGFQIYRTDRDWIEIYDGAAWRVHGNASVSSVANLSQVTDPLLNQQVRVTAAPAKMYQWNGTAWEPISSLVRPLVRAVSKAGVLLQADGTEKTITELNATYSVVTGENYEFEIELTGYGFGMTTTTWGQWRVRRTTALSGTLVEDGFWPWTTAIDSPSFRFNWNSTVTGSTNFYVSVQRNGGDGNLELVGDGRTRLKIAHTVDSITYVT